MPILTVSSKGQIVLPAGTRRRLGLAAGARLEAIEEGDGVRLRVVRSVRKSENALRLVLGPRRRVSPSRAREVSRASSASPAGPISEKPAEKITANFAFLFTASSKLSTTRSEIGRAHV